MLRRSCGLLWSAPASRSRRHLWASVRVRCAGFGVHVSRVHVSKSRQELPTCLQTTSTSNAYRNILLLHTMGIPCLYGLFQGAYLQ